MDGFSLVILSLSLAMDAFAASLACGMAAPRATTASAVKTAVFFGVFQALMPALGWLAGKSIADYVRTFDHWAVFAMFTLIGIKMIVEYDDGEDAISADPFGSRRLFMLAVATSIDALAAGVSLAVLDTGIIASACVIGAITFLVCLPGVLLGKKLAARFRRGATYAGGATLILLGLKTLLEHFLRHGGAL